MSGILKNSNKGTQAIVNQTEASMSFWGVECESGKLYAQVVGQRFRVTMAVLDPHSFNREFNDRFVTVFVIRDGKEYLLCVLKHNKIQQKSLNLIFDKGENVMFRIMGHGKVYLSGYQLTDSEGDVLNDESGYLCPLVEVNGKNKKGKTSMVLPKNQNQSKKRKSGESESPGQSMWSSFLNQNSCDDEEEDDEDEDFSPADECTDSDEESSDDDLDEDEEEKEDDKEEDDNEDDEEEDSEKEVVVNSHGSQKRKKAENLSVKKRSKNESFNSTSRSVKDEEKVICIEDNETSDSSSGEEDVSSFNQSLGSVGHTPMPKKKGNSEVEVSTQTKKSKKKKLSEMFSMSIKSENGKTSHNESTPKSQRPIHPTIIKGGVEMQDIIVGRGPQAVKGKMVHVFYVGRLENKKIFDSRLPGKKPFSFKLGAHQVIKGWDVGLEGMKVGGKRMLKIPPNMAYGKSGVEGIPPNSTLTFMVELQAVN